MALELCMSRTGDDWEPDYNNAYELWQHNSDLSIAGNRGQKALRDLLEALETLPEKRLADSRFAKNGAVCLVGAYVAHKAAKAERQPIHDVIRRLEAEEETFLDGDYQENRSGDYTVQRGLAAGLPTKTLAWTLVSMNDDVFFARTDEERWEKAVAWVRSKIKQEATA